MVKTSEMGMEGLGEGSRNRSALISLAVSVSRKIWSQGYGPGQTLIVFFFFFSFFLCFFPLSKLPSWARAVVPKIFYVTEKAWNYYPYTITGKSLVHPVCHMYSCEDMAGLRFH